MNTLPSNFIPAHGGELLWLYASHEQALDLRHVATALPSVDLSPRQLCDIELLLCGAFSPLTGFMCRDDYDGVLESMRLANGILWPMPITLDIDEALAERVRVGDRLALRDPQGNLIAVMRIDSLWYPDKAIEAKAVYGSEDPSHPGVATLRTGKPVYVGGPLFGVTPPPHLDFRPLRHTPHTLRKQLEEAGHTRVVAFQTRNPMHHAHIELVKRGVQAAKAEAILLHPAVGQSKPGDIDHFSRVRCYEHVLGQFTSTPAMLSLCPLAMRMAGPREALWHALIRQNYGASHFIVGRDHASPGSEYYPPYAAQEMLADNAEELAITPLCFPELAWVPARKAYLTFDELQPSDETATLSGTEFRRRLLAGTDVPEWFSPPEVVAELARSVRPTSRQGFTIFLTGLSASGKSTIANGLRYRLLEIGGREITMLDGDLIRKYLSSELTFSREHRDLNIRRIGYVAHEVTRHGGACICAAIAPYAAMRDEVRGLVSPEGGFIEVHVATPLSACEARDPKGLYAKARAGIITNFTGISDAYEEPCAPEVRIDTSTESLDTSVNRIIAWLVKYGYLHHNTLRES